MATHDVTGEKERVENPHWVSDVFPTKFSSLDFLANDTLEDKNSKFQLANDFYSKIYSKVILEEKESYGVKNDKLKTLARRLKATTEELREKVNDGPLKDAPKEQKQKKILWTAQELELFKISYDELRERAVWLLCVLENRNLKILDLKSKFNNAKESNCILEAKVSELSKENSHLRASASTHININKSLEQQLQFYEEANNILKDKILELRKESTDKEKECERKLKAFQEYRRQAEETMEKQKTDLKVKISELSIYYEKHISRLEDSISELENELKAKKKECKDCRNSITILEKHFQETVLPQVKQQQTSTKPHHHKRFLNVTDI